MMTPTKPRKLPPDTGSGTGGGLQDIEPRPLDLVSPQFTLRAVLTGMVLAAILSTCNIYTGLKIGWSLNMSITAALLSFGFWKVLQKTARTREWGILENNINQTACSSGASVSSAGLVAPVPALAMLTGQTLGWPYLALWVFSVCLVGITVAIALRQQMLIKERLPFVSGIASAETLKEMYAHGGEAMRRVKILAGAGVVAAIIKIFTDVTNLFRAGYAVGPFAGSISGIPMSQLTFRFDTNPLMYGVGALIGMRACISLLLGALLAWGVVAPRMLHEGNIRLEVTESLSALPSGVVLASPPDGYASYDAQRGLLKYQGVMSEGERDALLAQSADPGYQEAVRRLWMRSDRTAIAPVDEAMWTTTRPVEFAEEVGRVPLAFDLPRRLASEIRLDRGTGTLIAYGAMSGGARDDVLLQISELESTDPKHAEALGRLRAAVEDLYVRSNASLLDGGAGELTFGDGRLVYEDRTKTLRVLGTLTADDPALVEATETLSLSPATVASLASSTQFRSATPGYRDLVTWLLWPGVTMMVVASLVSFAFSWRSILATFRGSRGKGETRDTGEVTRTWFVALLGATLILSAALQISFFEIVWWTAVLGVLVTFLLAIVAARVSGETNITPVGAMGKVTQLMFGVIAPSQPAPNLMAANVTGGAASQCADLLHDMKCGWLLGASPRLQSLAQICGALAGAMAGSFVYLVLFPNPSEQLMSNEWPAPAVATWKAVAELFQVGFRAIPEGTPMAMVIGAVAALVLVFVEKLAPEKWRKYTLSPASIGLAFVVHAHYSITMFLGAVMALVLARTATQWTKKYLVVAVAGIVAGESLTGVGVAFSKIDFATILERIFG
jgi:uncharacterized oligopeptide transporter (OPT) family protein